MKKLDKFRKRNRRRNKHLYEMPNYLEGDEFYHYKSVVLYLTGKIKTKLTQGYTTGLVGTPGAWQIDYIFSIKDGFREKISPLLIGSHQNLRMLPWQENISKHGSSDMTKDQLFDLTKSSEEKSEAEFKIIQDLILDDISKNRQTTGGYLLERFYESNL